MKLKAIGLDAIGLNASIANIGSLVYTDFLK